MLWWNFLLKWTPIKLLLLNWALMISHQSILWCVVRNSSTPFGIRILLTVFFSILHSIVFARPLRVYLGLVSGLVLFFLSNWSAVIWWDLQIVKLIMFLLLKRMLKSLEPNSWWILSKYRQAFIVFILCISPSLLYDLIVEFLLSHLSHLLLIYFIFLCCTSLCSL